MAVSQKVKCNNCGHVWKTKSTAPMCSKCLKRDTSEYIEEETVNNSEIATSMQSSKTTKLKEFDIDVSNLNYRPAPEGIMIQPVDNGNMAMVGETIEKPPISDFNPYWAVFLKNLINQAIGMIPDVDETKFRPLSDEEMNMIFCEIKRLEYDAWDGNTESDESPNIIFAIVNIIFARIDYFGKIIAKIITAGKERKNKKEMNKRAEEDNNNV